MGRGRAKAKQTKVARELKYHSPATDYRQLEKELSSREWDIGSEGSSRADDADDSDESDDDEYAAYGEFGDDDSEDEDDDESGG